MSVFHQRSLLGCQAGSVTLLDAVSIDMVDGQELRFYFQSGTPVEMIAPLKDYRFKSNRSIGGGLLSIAQAPKSLTNPPLPLIGQRLPVTPNKPEPELFAGLNTIMAQRNGESADTVLAWLEYHVTVHGAEGVIILDRAEPETDDSFANKLENNPVAGLKSLVLVNSPVPLGAKNLPDEGHAFNAPDAPGKDRMEIPPADPWRAPLGDMLIYELLKTLFLSQAHAVVSLECYDMLAPIPDRTIFDAVQKSETGALLLLGQRCYPWRLRKGTKPSFGDHICRQFDAQKAYRRWAIDLSRIGIDRIWRLARVVGAEAAPQDTAQFYRCMALRHHCKTVSEIVPKTSLVEDDALLKIAEVHFNHKPVRVPEQKAPKTVHTNSSAIVTTMKNEGPFILEWVAYHKSIGVDELLVYTNDCDDGTDTLLDVLQEKGELQHRDNPFKESGLKPQHAALQAAESEPQIKNADWVTCIDVDEFITIHAGKGKLADLFHAVKDANMISMTWRLFGNDNVHEFKDGFITEQFNSCAPEYIRKPHQAWGFKTLFRTIGIFKKLGVHRPKGLRPQLWEQIKWVNGSGAPLPSKMFRNGWRSTPDTYGYDLVTLNHYAVRSAESFLVKRDRGRVNHVDRDQGLAYWFRMNNNAEHNTQIHRNLPAAKAEFDRLMADPNIRAAHEFSVQRHREKIDALRATDNYAKFYQELTGERMQRMSKMHAYFGANVFLSGPEVVPDNIVMQDHPEDFFFTVEKGETVH
ncbi:glycosyltransferase family 2 protein [Falsihalocynthiibacter sp. BN13B15]|uniref:glycosyltransferase family 2 protein n=1 Tax=Falsihalocynthiibacter sp. BN13B15 TaxID=3240871 RepID=UPI00350EF2B1